MSNMIINMLLLFIASALSSHFIEAIFDIWRGRVLRKYQTVSHGKNEYKEHLYKVDDWARYCDRFFKIGLFVAFIVIWIIG